MLSLRSVSVPGIWKLSSRSASVTSNVIQDKRVKSIEEIPGPSRLPILGQFAHYLPGGSLFNTQNLWKHLYEEYGPIVQLNGLFMPLMIVVYDDDEIEKIFRNENNSPLRPGSIAISYYRKNFSKLTTKNIIGVASDSGEYWKRQRSVLNPIMLPTNNIRHYANGIDEVTQDMVKRLKILLDENNKVPTFIDDLKLYLLETNFMLYFGKRKHVLDIYTIKNYKDILEYKIMITTGLIIQMSGELDTMQNWKYFPSLKFQRFKNMFHELESYGMKTIEVLKKDLQHNKRTDGEKSFLEKMAEIDEETAAINAIDLTFGPIETLRTVMMTIMYCLAKNPEVQVKLRKKLGTSEWKRYLKACMKESLRILPLNTNGRVTTKEYDILGYRIPKNTIVLLNTYYSQLSEKNYHRSGEFIPERWLLDQKDESINYRNAHPFSFTPFGFGVRSCVGRRLVEMQLEIFFGRLIENFSIDWTGPPPTFKLSALGNLMTNNHLVFKEVSKK